MPSGDDLQLAGELSCENAQVRCHLQVGCDIDIAGDINATNVNATTATIGTLVVGSLRVDQLAMRELNVPSINTSPQNNLLIAGIGSAMLLRFMLAGGPGTISLTGLQPPTPAIGGYSRIWVFFNRKTSSKTLTIEHENAGSMVSNRFSNHGAVARIIAPGEARSYYYDEGDSRWIEVS